MRRLSAVVVSATLFAAVSLLVPRIAVSQQSSLGSSRPDSLTAQLIELELQRVTRPVSSVLFADARPRDVSGPIATIHALLRALPNGPAAEQEAMNRVALALEIARSSSLQSQQDLRLVFTDEHAAVRLAEEERRAIDRRLTRFRATK